MTDEKSLTTIEPTVMERQAEETPLQAILRIASDPNLRIEVMDRLVELHERAQAMARQVAFRRDLANLQQEIPQITKEGRILDRNEGVRNKYAKLEDVDATIRPLLAKYGFAVSYDSEAVQKDTKYLCHLSHREGHRETNSLVLPLDTGAGRNAVQSVGSTTSYARRYLLYLHLNIVTRDQDNDGEDIVKVTQDQEHQLIELQESTAANRNASDVADDAKKFLRYMGVPTFGDILARDYEKARAALKAKGGAR